MNLLKQGVALIGLLLLGFNLAAQCHIHPNFRSIANMQQLNAIYEIQLTMVGTRINGQQYTARGTTEICDITFGETCTKNINIQTMLSDGTSVVCIISIDFVENSLRKRQDNSEITYYNIQRKGNSYYTTASDGTILTISFIKQAICLK